MESSIQTSPSFKCLFLGSQCEDVHLVSVPGRIGVRVRHPRDLETRYWIRSWESENVHVARDLRRTMKKFDSIRLGHNDQKFTVVFVDQVSIIRMNGWG